MKKSMRMLVVCFFAIAMAVTAHAVNTTCLSGQWNTAGNWDSGIPTSADTANVGVGVVLSGAAGAAYAVYQPAVYGDPASDLTINTDLTMTFWYLGLANSAAVATINSGVVTVPVLYGAYGVDSSAVINLNGGTLDITYTGSLMPANGTATINITGGTLKLSGVVTDISTKLPVNWTAKAYDGTGLFQYSYDVVTALTSITAIPLPKCGDWGYSMMDFNDDCKVDLADFAEFAKEWLVCTDPTKPGCVHRP